MEITKDSLLKIQSHIPTGKKLDITIYDKVIDILRSDSLFKNPIKFEKTIGEPPAYVDGNTGIFHYSDDVIPFSENWYAHFAFLPGYNDIDAFNYKLLFTLLHELAHLKQYEYATQDSGLIGRIYKGTLLSDDRDDEHYNNNYYDYVYEYNADIEATRIMKKIYEGNPFLSTLNLMEFFGLINNCYFDGDIYIADKTLKLLGTDEPEVRKIHDMPIDVLVHNGLPVNDDVLDELYSDPGKARAKYNL